MRRLLALFLLSLIAVAPLGARSGELSLMLTTGEDYPPFTDSELPYGGMATRMVLRAFEHSGIHVKEVTWLPWKRGYELSRAGEFDGTFPYGLTAERAAVFYFSDPFFPVKDYAWVRRGSDFDPIGEKDLRGKVYCRARGYGDFGMIGRLSGEGAIRRETPSTMAKCFKMLLVGRVDFVSSGRDDALNALTEADIDPDMVVARPLVLADLPLHLIVSRSHPNAEAILAAFNHGLAQMRESGEIERLQAEFGWRE